MTITASQLPSSYNFNLELVDANLLTFLLVVKDSEDNEIYNNENYETNTEVIIQSLSAGIYTIEVYELVDDDWDLFDDSTITILEYQMDIDWTYTVGDNYQIEPEVTYSYLPNEFIYNNNACPTPVLYPSQITYSLYDLINGVWVLRSNSTTTINLSTTWDDEDPDYSLLEYEYTTEGYPLKIITTVSNCNQITTNDTYVNQEFLITSIDEVNTHSEVQTEASYTITFNYSFGNQNGDHPMLVITPENSSYTKCNLYIYKNNNIIHSYEGLTPSQFYSYTFADPTITGNGGIIYQVKYISTNGVDSFEEIFPFTVQEYKPTFNLPTIQCLKINEPATIALSSLRFNCFAEDSSLHIIPGEYTPNINYKLYYLNPNTYTWELQGTQGGVNTPDLPDDAADYLTENLNDTDAQVSNFLANKYRFGSSDTVLWTPNKLTMVKLVVEVTNYSTKVTKETIFPICGTWKIRRMACGKYRIYNYTANPINFIIEKSNNGSFSQFKTLQVGILSFDSLELPDDGIYKVTGGGLTKYIFNFCALENCILELQKKVLLDDTLCDACKLDKVLYQKALRLIPIYETWKKLLDRDWVYEIQYQSTDVAGSLIAIYDAEELYLELKDLCESCDYKSEKCNCK
jgi:hypothetical protein